MKMSLLLGERFKEHPSDTTLESHAFLLRGGYIRQVAGGIFSLLPPAKKISQKIKPLEILMCLKNRKTKRKP